VYSTESQTAKKRRLFGILNRPFELFDDLGVKDLSSMKGDDYAECKRRDAASTFAVPHAHVAHPVTHENCVWPPRAAEFGIGIGIGIGIGFLPPQ
jgi:hypothetical protein